MFMRYSKK